MLLRVIEELSKRERAHNERVKAREGVGHIFKPRKIQIYTGGYWAHRSQAGILYNGSELVKMRKKNGVGRPPRR